MTPFPLASFELVSGCVRVELQSNEKTLLLINVVSVLEYLLLLTLEPLGPLLLNLFELSDAILQCLWRRLFLQLHRVMTSGVRVVVGLACLGSFKRPVTLWPHKQTGRKCGTMS